MNAGQCFKSLPSMGQTSLEDTHREPPAATHGPISSRGAAAEATAAAQEEKEHLLFVVLQEGDRERTGHGVCLLQVSSVR